MCQKSEVLVLQVAQAGGEHTGARQQSKGECGLRHDERFLRESGVVSRGSVDAAQRFGGIGMAGEPSRYDTEDDARPKGVE